MATGERAEHPKIGPIPVPEGLARHWKRVGLGLAVAGAGALGLYSVLSGHPDTSEVSPDSKSGAATVPFNPSQEQPGLVPSQDAITAPQESTNTADTQKPTNPEAKQEVNCRILDPELCKTAELIETKTAQGAPVKMAAFRLKENDSIRSIGTFQVAKAEIAQPATFKGYSATLTNPNDRSLTYTIIGDLKFDNMLTIDARDGQIIGRIGNRGVINFGEYNLVVYISRLDPNTRTFSSADDVLENLFPDAFKKPPKLVSNQSPSGQAITYTDTFGN